MTDILRGAATENMRRTGHDQISPYGLLRANSVAEVRAWIDQLIGQDLLRVAVDQYPTLVVSQTGAEVLRRTREVTLYALPPQRVGRRASRGARRTLEPEEGEILPVDEALFERLRALRRELARARGVPRYVIFNDMTLEQMAAKKPASEAEFRAIEGVGDKQAADLGPAFLACVAGG
ncbi:MAG: HRDC domain-containing protein [Planctomycetes bacterium]|nr:HRDC domain-containing protein [Planctomycetota bacterium]